MKPSLLLLKLLMVEACVVKVRLYVRRALLASRWTKEGRWWRANWLREARAAAGQARYFEACWNQEVLAA